ncbi:hypothetical protein [Campylobacter devanensis]|uniref:hypothetical protein n=1 Tax=Campylobacter devanensis TaxID=3161138 RepID=UPI000A333849|nr:hypothetical protein [Campylobacter sp. P0136]
MLFILLNGVKSKVYNIANVNLKFELPNKIELKGYSKQADSVLSAQELINIGWSPLYDINISLENTFKIKKELDF